MTRPDLVGLLIVERFGPLSLLEAERVGPPPHNPRTCSWCRRNSMWRD
jgi:hypothetical protein